MYVIVLRLEKVLRQQRNVLKIPFQVSVQVVQVPQQGDLLRNLPLESKSLPVGITF